MLLLVRGAAECKRIFKSLYYALAPSAAPSPSRPRQRTVLASSSFFGDVPPGPSAHSPFTPRHPMSTYPGAAQKRTSVSLSCRVLPCCARLLTWPGRTPPTGLAGLHARRLRIRIGQRGGPLALTRASEARTAWWWYLRDGVRVAVSRGLPLAGNRRPAVSRRRPIAACPTRSTGPSI